MTSRAFESRLRTRFKVLQLFSNVRFILSNTTLAADVHETVIADTLAKVISQGLLI